MPRTARKKSENGIYHIIVRGINRQSIFEDDADRQKLLQTLLHYKEQCGYQIYAYCLMGNHVHLLLKEGREPLAQIMRRIWCCYVYWYNHKYNRIGNLFQDRYKSEPIENETYFITVLRYIHQNPLKAGMVEDISSYAWSSYPAYVGNGRMIDNLLIEREKVLTLFGNTYDNSITNFISTMYVPNSNKCLDIMEKSEKINDDQAKEMIEKIFGIKPVMLQNMSREKQEYIVQQIVKIKGISVRQLSRISGVSAHLLTKLKKGEG